LSGIDLASQRITSVASPSSATDAANKAYVDALASGLEWKAAVRVATTTNGTLATAYANGSVVDTVTLATGDRILLKNQTTQTDNGIYTVNASGAPTRATDANTSASLNNATVLVLSGSQADTAWTQTTANPTIGTSNIVFVAFGGGAVYTASSAGGLSLSAGAFSLFLDTNPGLTTSSTGTKVLLGSNPGLTTTGGLAVSLAGTNPALTTTGGLAVIPGSGITVAGNSVAVDRTKVPNVYSQAIGDGSTTAITVTHGLNTLDVQVQVYTVSGGAQVECDVTHTSSTVVTLTFAVAPTTGQYRTVIMG
jgi:hypothetical protein